jgi:NAD(P)H dehydrogenase (quinone)
VAALAEEIRRGAASVAGVEAKLWQVPETLPDEALAKMGAPPKRAGVPAIVPAELVEVDGVLFGFPTRFGMLPAQMKAFFDGTSGLWCEQRLAGKPAGIFCSSACQGGGQDFVIDLFH